MTAKKATRQCRKCPWKVSTDPNDIPHGYDVEKHRKLRSTIADRDGPPDLSETLRIMACHHSPVGAERPCVGWLHNQLNEGNNIGLRYAVHLGRIRGDYELDGQQHMRFEDTLPR